MFGASVLVPILFNSVAKTTVVDPSLVLMMNGVGTLIYLFICRGKAPAFLGSSFAFLSPTFAVIAAAGANPQLGFQHAPGGFVVAGLIFVIVSLIIRWAGREWLNVVSAACGDGLHRHAHRTRAGGGRHQYVLLSGQRRPQRRP